MAVVSGQIFSAELYHIGSEFILITVYKVLQRLHALCLFF